MLFGMTHAHRSRVIIIIMKAARKEFVYSWHVLCYVAARGDTCGEPCLAPPWSGQVTGCVTHAHRWWVIIIIVNGSREFVHSWRVL